MRIVPGPALLTLACSLLLGVAAAGPASAQDAGAADSTPEAPAAAPSGESEAAQTSTPEPVEPLEAAPGDVELIAITGERIDSADVQDEAQAISAFTAEDLDRANIVNVDSLAFSVPGLHVGQSGQSAIITLRGVGTENASLTGEPGVAFHVDGINLGRPSAARVAFFDLETLEVKRGPQGLLGGKNSTSGHINLITNKPHDEYEVKGDILFGNYDRVRARGSLNIPLGEFAATRLAFFHEDRDGYLDNKLLGDSRDPFDADDFGMRAHLRLNPAETVQVLLSWNYFKQTGNGPQADNVPTPKNLDPIACFGRTFTTMPLQSACFRTVIPSSFDPNRVPPFIPSQNTPNPAVEDRSARKIWVDTPSAQDNRYWGWTAAIDWDAPALPLLGESRVKLLGGFQKTVNIFNQDFDATSNPMLSFDLDAEADQYSSELQWSGQIAERLDWQSSFFYSHEQARRDIGVPPLTVGRPTVQNFQTTENKSYGAALHGTFHATDSLRLNLGGRWIKDKKSTWMLRSVLPSSDDPRSAFRGCTGDLGTRGTFTGPVPLRENDPCSKLERHTMWGAGIDWRPEFGFLDGNHLLYAKIDRGAKSGGFRAGTVGEYDPEKIWAYALGSKSNVFDDRLQINLEGFFYAYDGMQLVILDGLSLRTENTDARMYGWDLEAVGNPIPGLMLSAVISYLNTETRDYFSIDPAAADSNVARARLRAREASESSIQSGLGFLPFEESELCVATELGGDIACGLLGDRNGLDDFTGNQLSRSPEWKFTFSAEYEIPLGRFGTLIPRVQYTWQDDTYFRAFNREFDLQEDHHLTDAKLIWISPEDRWEVEVFVQNIEDEAPKSNILIGPREFGSPPLGWYGPPRFFGARLGFKY